MTSADPIGHDFGWQQADTIFANTDGTGGASPFEAQAIFSNALALDLATHWGDFFDADNALIAPDLATGTVAGVTPSTYITGEAAAWNSGAGVGALP